MYLNEIYTAPKTLELKNFVFNPIAVINECPTIFLIYRPEHEIQVLMDEYTNDYESGAQKSKLIPKKCIENSKEGRLFHQKIEEKSAIVTKVTTCQLKILSLMDDLQQILSRSPKFTDHSEHFKQRKLFSDFMVRFSRNYIYEVDRIVIGMIEEIQFYQVDHFSYFERSTNYLINKVSNLFTVMMRALQVYQKQLAKMNNENCDKLLHFTELIIIGINICVELKIFDEDDMLIKLLLEKSEKFISFLREKNEPQLVHESVAKTLTSSTSLTKKVSIPTKNRYMMYASKAKKLKPAESSMTLMKTKGKGKNVPINHHQPGSGDQQSGNIQTMFESKVCLGWCEKSSDNDAYEEAVKKNCMQFHDQMDANFYFENSEVEQDSSENNTELFSSDE